MKKFLQEFKEFALKGNVMDMAIGVIIGAAFQDIVKALTSSFITPLIQALTGGADSEGVTIGGQFVINGVAFTYGAFITAVVNFIIMAFILFCLLKVVSKLMTIGKKPAEEVVTTKICPYCCTKIDIKATKCPSCTSDLK